MLTKATSGMNHIDRVGQISISASAFLFHATVHEKGPSNLAVCWTTTFRADYSQMLPRPCPAASNRRSDHRDEFPLGVGVAVNVSLGRLNRAMSC
jgi:hypothetical protein